MAKNKYSYAEAATEASAGLDATLSIPNVIGRGYTTEEELTVAKVIEIESQHVSTVLGVNIGKKKVTMTATEEALVNQSKNAILQAPGARAKINEIEQKLKITPLTRDRVLELERDLNNEGSVRGAAICSQRDIIILFASVRKEINKNTADLPNNLTLITPADRGTITTMPIVPDITGTKAFAGHTVELIDSSGNVVAADKNTIGRGFSLSTITGLENKQHFFKIRITNPLTQVIHEMPYTLTVNAPKPPETPENMNTTITCAPGARGALTGKLKTAGHTVEIFDENGVVLPPADFNPALTTHYHKSTNGTFHFSLPGMAASGTRKFQLKITNPPGTGEHIEHITLNVSEPAAPTIAPLGIATTPQMTHTDVPLGEHHAHIEHHNPIPGSTITISGQGLTNPVNINVPLDHPLITPFNPAVAGSGRPRPLPINLPGFDTHTAGIKNMTIVTTDPHNPNNKRTDNFDITVEVDPHHQPDNRKLNKAYFMNCMRNGSYQIQGDETIPAVWIMPRNPPTNYVNTRPLYNIGGFPGRYYAQVPFLPGEKPFGRRYKRLTAATQNGLYDKIQLYLRELNARAAAMNHGDHDEHGDHSAEHPAEHPATPATHTAPSGNDAHEAAAGGHPEGGSESSGGTFGQALKTVAMAPIKLFNKQPAWVRGAEIGLGYALYAGGAVLAGPAIMGGAIAGATWWGLKKLWRIKNPKKGGDSDHSTTPAAH